MVETIRKIDEMDVRLHHNINKLDSSIWDVTKKIKNLEIKKEKTEQHPVRIAKLEEAITTLKPLYPPLNLMKKELP